MKKLLCVFPAFLLFALINVPNAHADSYTPTFSCNLHASSDLGCYYIGNGYTASEVSFPTPTIQVAVPNPDGVNEVYDVTLSASDTPTDSFTYEFAEYNSPAPPPFNFALDAQFWINDLTTGITNYSASTFLDYSIAPPVSGVGTLTFPPVSAAAPEPAPIILMLLGAGLIFFMRRRFAVPLQRTA